MSARVAAAVDRTAIALGKDMADAATFNLFLNEEGMTERLLVQIARSAGSSVQVNAFTRHQESANGADWDLFVQNPGSPLLKFRMQAKRLRGGRFQFDYGRPKYRQLARLIVSAYDNRMTPVYALYAHDPSSGACAAKCSHYQQPGIRSIRVMSIPTVLHLTPSADLAAVKSRSLPMSCLFRCGAPITKPPSSTGAGPHASVLARAAGIDEEDVAAAIQWSHRWGLLEDNDHELPNDVAAAIGAAIEHGPDSRAAQRVLMERQVFGLAVIRINEEPGIGN